MCRLLLHVKSMQLSLIFWQHFWGQARSCLPCHLPYTLLIHCTYQIRCDFCKNTSNWIKNPGNPLKLHAVYIQWPRPMAASFHALYTRNTPGSICQYKEDGLVSRPPSLLTSMRRPMHGTSCPKSQLKSTYLTAKFGSFFKRPRGNRRKRTKCDQFFCPTSDFFDFCNPWFLLSYLYGFCWQSLQYMYAEICDHSLFTLQFC